MDSNTSSPARQQTPPRSSKVRRQKLRMSCDGCSNTKTKCDQTRPACLRCVKMGVECNYSISQRKGKPPASARTSKPSTLHSSHPAHSSIQSSMPTNEFVNTPQDFAATPPASYQGSPVLGDLLLPFEQSMLLDLDMSGLYHEGAMPDLFHSYVPNRTDFFSAGPPLYDTTFGMPTPPASLFKLDAPAPCAPAYDDFSELLDFGHADAASLSHLDGRKTERERDTDDEETDCATEAARVLATLSLPLQTCPLARGRHGQPQAQRSFDQILILNAAAMAATQRLLACSCSSALTIAHLLERILSLYQSSMRSAGDLAPLSPASNTSSTTTANPSTAHLRDTPIAIGAYRMHGVEAEWMRMHVLDKELRKVGVLVEAFATGMGEGEGGREREGRRSMGEMLRERWVVLVEDVKGRLRC